MLKSRELIIKIWLEHISKNYKGILSIYFDEALKYGEDPDAFIEKVLNRIDLQTSDFMSRILEQTKSKSHVDRLKEIREIINFHLTSPCPNCECL